MASLVDDPTIIENAHTEDDGTFQTIIIIDIIVVILQICHHNYHVSYACEKSILCNYCMYKINFPYMYNS